MNPEQHSQSPNPDEQNPDTNQVTQNPIQPIIVGSGSHKVDNAKRKAVAIVVVIVAALIAVGASLFVVLRSDSDDQAATDSQTSTNNTATVDEQKDDQLNSVTDQSASSSAQKAAANNVLAAIMEYSANNRGVLPSTDSELQKIATDSGLSDILVQVKESYIASDVPTDQNTYYYYKAHTCSEDTNTPVAGSSREFVLIYTTAAGLQCVSS